MKNYLGFTQGQFLILLGLVTTIILILSFGLIYVVIEKSRPIIATSPENIIPPVVSSTAGIVATANLLPTTTPIPTYAYLPTATLIPSPTSFVIAPITIPTSKSSSAPTANPNTSNSTPDCSSALDYAAAMHQYNLDSIDYIHSPLISYYQSLIDEAVRNRDALAVVQAQNGLANEEAQVNAEKTSENNRYKAEVANIKANCK